MYVCIRNVLYVWVALKRRFENQNLESKVLFSYLDEMNDSLRAIDTAVNKSSIRLNDMRTKQSALYNKLLTVLSKIEVLRCRNVPMKENEVR
jgi:hypothetical protein